MFPWVLYGILAVSAGGLLFGAYVYFVLLRAGKAIADDWADDVGGGE